MRHFYGSLEQKGWDIEFSQDWTDLLHGCNWYDVTIVHLSGEYSPYQGSCEANVGLLGFHVRFYWKFREDTEMDHALDAAVESVFREGASRPAPEE